MVVVEVVVEEEEEEEEEETKKERPRYSRALFVLGKGPLAHHRNAGNLEDKTKEIFSSGN